MFVMFSETFLINITEYQYQTRIIKILTTVLSFLKLVLPTTTQQEGNLFSTGVSYHTTCSLHTQ